MIDMIVSFVGTTFFILGFVLVIGSSIFIMSRKDEDTIHHDHYSR